MPLTRTIARPEGRDAIVDLARRAMAGDVGMLDKMAAQVIPVGRPGTTEEIAATCGFLCSDEAAFITGQVVIADGGFTAR